MLVLLFGPALTMPDQGVSVQVFCPRLGAPQGPGPGLNHLTYPGIVLSMQAHGGYWVKSRNWGLDDNRSS